jgi:hypothetical protein
VPHSQSGRCGGEKNRPLPSIEPRSHSSQPLYYWLSYPRSALNEEKFLQFVLRWRMFPVFRAHSLKMLKCAFLAQPGMLLRKATRDTDVAYRTSTTLLLTEGRGRFLTFSKPGLQKATCWKKEHESNYEKCCLADSSRCTLLMPTSGIPRSVKPYLRILQGVRQWLASPLRNDYVGSPKFRWQASPKHDPQAQCWLHQSLIYPIRMPLFNTKAEHTFTWDEYVYKKLGPDVSPGTHTIY